MVKMSAFHAGDLGLIPGGGSSPSCQHGRRSVFHLQESYCISRIDHHRQIGPSGRDGAQDQCLQAKGLRLPKIQWYQRQIRLRSAIIDMTVA